MRASIARRGASVAVAAALLAVGCSTTLDTADLERQIEEGIEEQTGEEVDRVDCPDDVEAKAGDTFRCLAFAPDGSSAPVEVTQLDDEGNVEWEVLPPENDDAEPLATDE